MGDLEDTATMHETSIQQLQTSSLTQSVQLRDLHRHLEDLDNQGRRHNLRVSGLTEIFNDLLGRPPETPIEYERLHIALKPRSRDIDPPRDVIDCLVNFKLKEDILRRARDCYNLLIKAQT